MYLQQITERQFHYIENTFQPILLENEGRGVEATEIEDENRFVDLLSAEETFLCTTDSATKAEVLLEKLVHNGCNRCETYYCQTRRIQGFGRLQKSHI